MGQKTEMKEMENTSRNEKVTVSQKLTERVTDFERRGGERRGQERREGEDR